MCLLIIPLPSLLRHVGKIALFIIINCKAKLYEVYYTSGSKNPPQLKLGTEVVRFQSQEHCTLYID